MAQREKFEVLLRFKAIELIAYWEGRLITSQLMRHFGISRQQASKDIKQYQERYNSQSLEYSPDIKGYRPTKTFKPKLTNGHINEYMDLMSGLVSQSVPITLIQDPHIASVHMPDRAVKPEVVRELIQACRANQALSIEYSSMNNPTPHERVISPHTLIYSGFRWHVRAYCHERHEYRDFVVSRISQIFLLDQSIYISNGEDTLWHEEIELNIIPNQNLNDQQQLLVAKDFVMTKGILKMKVKKALIHYTLQRYQVAINESEKQLPKQYHLQLEGALAIEESYKFE